MLLLLLLLCDKLSDQTCDSHLSKLYKTGNLSRDTLYKSSQRILNRLPWSSSTAISSLKYIPKVSTSTVHTFTGRLMQTFPVTQDVVTINVGLTQAHTN